MIFVYKYFKNSQNQTTMAEAEEKAGLRTNVQNNDQDTLAASKPKEQINSLTQLAGLLLTISMGALNLGYVLSYMTLTIRPLFQQLDIERTDTLRLSLINAVMPMGALTGSLSIYFLRNKYGIKRCLHIADYFGILSLVTLIPNYITIAVFRFSLGVSNGMNSVIIATQLKLMCPEKYYPPFSMVIGYFTSTGILIGQLFGIGYITFDGENSLWWKVVFLFPAAVCITRSTLLQTIYDYDSPDECQRLGHIELAKKTFYFIYEESHAQKLYIEQQKKVVPQRKPLFRVFKEIRHQRTVLIGVLSNLCQQWCGSFAVFYYGAQINEQLAKGDLGMITVYTVSIGICMFFPQFLNIYLQEWFGTKKLLVASSFIIGGTNIAIVVVQSLPRTDETLLATFILLLVLIATFSMMLQPQTWSITARINEPDGAYVSLVFRWAFQLILILSFPYVVQGIEISGGFIIFACVAFFYSGFVFIFVLDMKGLTQAEIDNYYARENQKTQQSE